MKIKRIVYGLVGLAGLGGGYWILSDWSSFVAMSWWSIGVITLLEVGAVNWGTVAVTGNKDLLEVLGLK